jgi:hypothetical protein
MYQLQNLLAPATDYHLTRLAGNPVLIESHKTVNKDHQTTRQRRWTDPVSGRVVRIQNDFFNWLGDGHMVITQSDFHFNQPPPRGVFDWSPPTMTKPVTQTNPGDQARLLAGLTAVQGPGVIVTLKDGKHRANAPVAAILGTMIHDTDINQVVNELKAAGAEAIAVNDQRLVATSPIRCAGPTVLVNNVPQPPPYVIRAIGSAATMQAALNLPDGVGYRSLRHLDPAMFRIETASQLILPPYRGSIQDRYARPVATASRKTGAEGGFVEKLRQFVITWRVPVSESVKKVFQPLGASLRTMTWTIARRTHASLLWAVSS